jgi:deoxyinosine 3'endonuclease (endonuclease V)
LATIVGVLLPMACIGVAVYLLARRPCSANDTPDDDS